MHNTQFSVDLVQPKICRNPVFIIGAPRSGTTILAESLAKHSHLWASDESEILLDLFGKGHLDKAFERVCNLQGGSWIRRERVERAELLAFLGVGMNALFTSRSQGRRWIDHTNLYTLMADTLAEMFPDALFLHALRDGRRAVHSTLRFYSRFSEADRATKNPSGRLAPWAVDFKEACKVWRRYVEAGLRLSLAYPKRCLTVVNEEIVADPRGVLTQVFEFIGVPFEDEPVRHIATTRINTSFPELYSSADSAKKLTAPWKEWNLGQRKMFLESAGETMVNSGRMSQAELDQLTAELEPLTAKLVPLTAELDPAADEVASPIRTDVLAHIPETASVMVISKGDDELLNSIGRRACHFPQTEEGWYAGHHPADSQEAILHLKSLQAKGSSFLLIPAISMWWLNEYREFANYLNHNCERLQTTEEYCVIYSLNPPHAEVL